MKKIKIALLSIAVLAFPSLVNALELESCPEQITVGEEVTLKLKETEDILETDKFNWSSSSTSSLTVNKKTEDNGKSAVIKGVAAVNEVSITVTSEDESKTAFCQTKVVAAKSKDATLKKLGVTNYELSPKFDKDTLEYKVTIPEKTTKVTITGETTDEKAKAEGLKEVTLDKDNMTAKVEVTAEDGENKKTYTIKFEYEKPKATPKAEITDFTLKKLKITGAELDPKFDKNTFKYTLKVKNGEKPKVTAYESTDPNAQVFVVSNDKGITITVTDGKNEKKYELLLPEEKKEANTNLSRLELVAYPFNEAFSKDVTRYTVTIPYEVEEVTLKAVAEDPDAKVTNTPLRNLKVGENTITVTVKSVDKSKDYVIIVTRSKKEEATEKTTSIIKTTGNTSKNSDYDIPEVDSPDSVLNLITVTIASLILLATGVIGIYFFVKTSPKKLKKEALNKDKAQKASPLIEAKPKKNKIEELDSNDDNDKNKDA